MTGHKRVLLAVTAAVILLVIGGAKQMSWAEDPGNADLWEDQIWSEVIVSQPQDKAMIELSDASIIIEVNSTDGDAAEGDSADGNSADEGGSADDAHADRLGTGLDLT